MAQKNQSFVQQSMEGDLPGRFRDAFIIPSVDEREQIYFLGNSLGLQPRRTAAYLQEVLEQWGRLGVEGYFQGDAPWLEAHGALVRPLAQIVGAEPGEVVVMNGLTVNLHLMMASFYRPEGRRCKILCEAKAFPSDQYLLESQVRHHGLDPARAIVEVAPRPGGALIRTEDILEAISTHGDELALVLWGGVNYYTGQVFDMAAITGAAQAVGAAVGFDLAHAAGNIPLSLHRWGVDFACWCSYKYLNSGPGAVGGAFIHERHHGSDGLRRLAGWWGYRKEDRFRMLKGFQPHPGAEGWQVSSPSILQFAAHKAALEIFMEAELPWIFQKGQQLSDHLLLQVRNINNRLGKTVIHVLTPPEAKGCQVSLYFQTGGRAVFDHLAHNGVFADWREPGVIRVAPVPLYNTLEEVERFGALLEEAVGSK